MWCVVNVDNSNDDVFSSSLSACSLWLWHCLGAVCMLSYM